MKCAFPRHLKVRDAITFNTSNMAEQFVKFVENGEDT